MVSDLVGTGTANVTRGINRKYLGERPTRGSPRVVKLLNLASEMTDVVSCENAVE